MRSSRYRTSRYRSGGGTYYSGGSGHHDGEWDTLDIIGLLLECAIVVIGFIAIIYLIWKYICRAKKDEDDKEERETEDDKQSNMTERSALAVEGSRYGPEYYSATEAEGTVAANSSWYDGVKEDERQMLTTSTGNRTEGSNQSGKHNVTERSAHAVEGSRNGPAYYSATGAVAANHSWYDGVQDNERQMLTDNTRNKTKGLIKTSDKHKFYGYM